MKRTTLVNWIGSAAIAMLALAGTAAPSSAYDSDFVVTGHAGVRVWVDGGDVFHDYDDVSVYVRADRDCYATVLLVDTDGFLHVLYPSTPYDRVWLRGGRTYRYSAWELGIHRLDGAGIAHLYAVGSPVPFDYSYYGASVFIGGFGFRVYGDPYIACRDFYVSLLPVSCRWDFVSVSSARFYVRQWVRYPAYLCTPGIGVHVRVGDSCRSCSRVYASYRVHASSPYEALTPVPKFKRTYARNQDGAPFGRVESVRPGFAKHRDDRVGTVTRATQKSPSKAIGRGPERRDPVGAKATRPVKVVSTGRTGSVARPVEKIKDPSARSARVTAPVRQNVAGTKNRVTAPVRSQNVAGGAKGRVTAPARSQNIAGKARVSTPTRSKGAERAVQKNASAGRKSGKGEGKRVREAR